MSPTTFAGARLKELFPGGFDKQFGQSSSRSSSSNHFASSPEQLYHALIERYDPKTPTESIIVTSALYGKRTKGARHEFIVVQIEDKDRPGLINYLVLDRNVNTPGQQRGVSSISSSSASALDSFRVSNDGDMDRLLKDVDSGHYRFLEKLSFPTESQLHLYELVTLADIVSRLYPDYHLLDSNCFMFAGAIWECLCLIRPSAMLRNDLAKVRGRYRFVRYVPSPATVQKIYEKFGEDLPGVDSRFRAHKGDTLTQDRAGESNEQYV
ncbi:hypothetical protein BDV93DRAFT_524401 [Ceratobasidium sp. AG-I]|nr:hypothetical protein BDV93DRAFT_524401 [Ceratobasidium sp. AG-I]